MAESPFHFFGIRHHGPGCARSLKDALEKLQPDCILLEGPPEGEVLLAFLQDPQLIPPVALLIFNPEDSKEAVFYPYAVFSPEWQALQFAQRQKIPLRFMDLSVSQSFALEKETEQPETVTDDVEEDSSPIQEDPLDWLGRAAGYDNGESWWNHLVEERCDSLELFAAIREAMVTVREEIPQLYTNKFKRYREQLREASMRKIMREAQKEFSRIAVICGAWHLPALEKMPAAKVDNDLLKGLGKSKTVATWVPWSYPHLTYESGYGAGILSPQWYEQVWLQSENHHRGIQWLTKAAHLFREEDLDCSSAQIIDAMRLADSLAALRDKPQPGLEELFESLTTTVCMGDHNRLQLIRKKLVVGDKLGQIPASVPSIPLQRDLEQQQKSLRMKADAAQKVLDLDLRQENDLARSHLLHRLEILNIRWGHLQDTGRSVKGSFHEVWTLEWQPGFALAIIDAGRWGNSVIKAATNKIIDEANISQSLHQVADLLNQLLLADLPDAMQPVTQRLENLAATSGDLLQLLGAIPPLTQIARYGNVRNTDTALVNQLLEHLVPRTAIALSPGCHSLDEDAARDCQKAILKAHQSIQLIANDELTQEWMQAINKLHDFPKHPALIAGMATRLIFDAKSEGADLTPQLMSQALSVGHEPVNSALWLEGFLQDSAMILLHDDHLWHLINDWILGLGADYFVETLPLIRRSFGQFSAAEKRQLGERANQSSSAKPVMSSDIDSVRGEKALLLVKQLLGMES